MNQVHILDGVRSYIGIKNSAYRHIPADILGASLLQKFARNIPAEEVDIIICGNSVGGGGNITRLMSLEAGLPESIPAVTVDLQCASSLESVISAASRIQSGLADLAIAGGFESTSTQPLRSLNPHHPDYKNSDTYLTAKFIPGPHREDAMLLGAEKTICRYHITRHELDRWVLESHKRADAARQFHLLDDIVHPVFGLDHDESIRPRISQKLLDKLPYVLKDGQYLNAANACSMNDGAAFVLLCSERYLVRHGLKSRCRVTDACCVGSDPLISPASALTSINRLLKRSGYSMDQIGAIECNEAFAAIDVLFERAYPEKCARYNMLGGALAYGHPYGASGAIILLHLIKAMEITKSQKGICSVAAAGGIGTSVLLERE